jgi:hypothetical protein
MKTAMQELIDWMGKNDYYGTGVFYAANDLLDKEKGKIKDAYLEGWNNCSNNNKLTDEKYYNQTYNQNK